MNDDFPTRTYKPPFFDLFFYFHGNNIFFGILNRYKLKQNIMAARFQKAVEKH